ncbi:nuclease-related domain-containing protein [Nocardia fusca]|uniref:nuclease-related domain-containing protein n=1 Tax=Nocardia fusca TaxID=941183 RepID=UPI0037C5D2A6
MRTRLPDTAPWAAWSNFTFTAQTGHVREVDLLVVSPSGVYLIELKDWRGKLTWQNGSWVQAKPGGGRRFHRSPVHLVNQKSKELASLLGRPPQISACRKMFGGWHFRCGGAVCSR